ncbi:coiled-coil domain-containing protein 57 [Lepisosteus oculatus]|uniref:coiled-coil domain-containing protein 57 n=1 Tax=Lepisosteus oculatus TaxID=7918 RepID=UPI00371436B6
MLDEGDLDALLASKEREWKELQAKRVQQLEEALRDTRAQLTTQGEVFQRLKEDFEFNLRVLEERDRELERYDAMAARLHSVESARRAETSELRIQIDKLQEAVSAEARKREELQRLYQQRVAEQHLQLETVQSAKGHEIERHREEYESLKHELERKIQEVEGELALQKQELMVEFDSEMKRREHEFILRMDEMSNVVLSHELKVKLLTKELEVHTKAHSEAVEALQASEELYRDAQKEIKRREWDIKDISAVKDARLKELEDKLSVMEMNRKKEEEIFNRKHEELDRCAREREAALVAVREAHAEHLRDMENKNRELQTDLDTLLMEKRRLEWSHADALREKEDQIEKLRGELETTRAGWDAYIAQVSKETVSKDMELQALGERESRLKTELQRYKEDVERYKQQVTRGVERERGLEQARVQAELDWQRRCEDAEQVQYAKNEELIQGLTQARDQVTAELREKERELQDMSAFLRSVTLERDQALAALSKNGLPSRERQLQAGEGSSFPSDEIRRLQQQNASLRAIIAGMRKDMEALSEQIPVPPAAPKTPRGTEPVKSPDSPGSPFIPEYTKSLEEEVKELKKKYRSLEEQLEEAQRAPSQPPAPGLALPVSADNAYLQNHIRTLNEIIGGLRAEKVSRSAALKKHEVRVAHLESAISQLTQQLLTKQAETDELRFELANQRKRSGAEEAGLRQRVVAVEMELAEARREAEEYQRGSLLQNLEAVSLGNQVSALKLDIASRREPIIVEQSEMVKQLQDENLRLRQLLVAERPEAGLFGKERVSVPALRSKLKQAVRYISQLTRDKEQLIEMGNRLRAQLADAGLSGHQFPSSTNKPTEVLVPSVSESHSMKSTTQDPQNRLFALEQLQYQLTTQELQYAQREQYKKTPIVVRYNLSDSESGDKVRINNPWDQHSKSDLSKEKKANPPHFKNNVRSRKENTPPASSHSHKPHQVEPSQTCPEGRPHSDQSQLFISSLGTDSTLQDVWQMLDRGLSSSGSTPQEGFERVPGVSVAGAEEAVRGPSIPVLEDSVRVQGKRADLQPRKTPGKSSEPSQKHKQHSKTPKIRNYNIKD